MICTQIQYSLYTVHTCSDVGISVLGNVVGSPGGLSGRRVVRLHILGRAGQGKGVIHYLKVTIIRGY